MLDHFGKTAIGCALAVVSLAHVANAQTAPGSAAAPAAAMSPVVANPTYISIPLEIAVNRPAAEVWKRIGNHSAISANGCGSHAP